MFFVHDESSHITCCCHSAPRDVPLCDSLWNILRWTAQHYTFHTLNSSSLLCTGMAHHSVHPCCSYNRQVLVTAFLHATNLVTKADSIPTVLGCMAAVQQVLPYLSQMSVWSLCEAVRTTGLQEVWLFRIVRSRRWKNIFSIHFHVQQLIE